MKDQALNLIDQLIEMEQERDKQHKALMIAMHRGKEAMGESSMLFHLKALRDLVQSHSVFYTVDYSYLPFATGSCVLTTGTSVNPSGTMPLYPTYFTT